MRIEIRIKGQIDTHWSTGFEDLKIHHDAKRDQTLLCGEVLDQAALYGLLAKLRDLGLALLLVTVDGSAMQDDDDLYSAACKDDDQPNCTDDTSQNTRAS